MTSIGGWGGEHAQNPICNHIWKVASLEHDKCEKCGEIRLGKIKQEDIKDMSERLYLYAKDILKGRFELGEKVISKNAHFSYLYASDILKGRFELGEKVISKNAHYSYFYAKYILKSRFELGEASISKDAKYRTDYFEFLNVLSKTSIQQYKNNDLDRLVEL